MENQHYSHRIEIMCVVQTVLCKEHPPSNPQDDNESSLNEAREVNSAIAELRTRATGHVSRCLGLGWFSMGQQFGADVFFGISMV